MWRLSTYFEDGRMFESVRIPLIKSIQKWNRMIFIISKYKLGIWICSQPRIDLFSQPNFYDVLTRPYKYLSTLHTRITCTQYNLHVSFTRYHRRSFSHPGVNRLCPSISAYRTRSFAHLGVSRLCPSSLTPLSASLPPSGSYCVNLSPCLIFLLDSRETPAKVAQSCFSVASWRHQASLVCPPPL